MGVPMRCPRTGGLGQGRGGNSKLYKLAGDPGFEPGLTDPESVVLPLD